MTMNRKRAALMAAAIAIVPPLVLISKRKAPLSGAFWEGMAIGCLMVLIVAAIIGLGRGRR